MYASRLQERCSGWRHKLETQQHKMVFKAILRRGTSQNHVCFIKACLFNNSRIKQRQNIQVASPYPSSTTGTCRAFHTLFPLPLDVQNLMAGCSPPPGASTTILCEAAPTLNHFLPVRSFWSWPKYPQMSIKPWPWDCEWLVSIVVPQSTTWLALDKPLVSVHFLGCAAF